jgi:hypothetical protein
MVVLLVLQFIFLFFIAKVKPYKDKYFNIMAMIDEMGVFICLALTCNTVFLTNNLTTTKITILSWVYAGIVEIVLILNIVMIFVYYQNRKGNPDVDDSVPLPTPTTTANKENQKIKRVEPKKIEQ